MTPEELEIAKAACCVGTIWDQYEGTKNFNEMVGIRVQHLIELVRNHLQHEQPKVQLQADQKPAGLNEDEKIRKEIVTFLREGVPYLCPNNIIRQKWATWIEKQKDAIGAARQQGYEEGMEDGASMVESMQKKQKPIPKFKVGDRIYDKRDSYNRNVIREVGRDYYINAFAQKMDMAYTDANFEFLEHLDNETPASKPTEWSEDDEKYLNLAINIVASEFGEDSPTVSWLKCIKDRIQ